MKDWRCRSVALALAGILLATAVGCSTGERAVGKKSDGSTTTTSPADCVRSSPADPNDLSNQATTTSIVQQCLEDAFLAVAADTGTEAVRALSRDQTLAFGHGLCAYAQALASDLSSVPSYREFVASTSASWGVDKQVVEDMIPLSESLCPGQLAPILALKASKGTVEVTWNATGTGPLRVTYTGPDGSEIVDTVASPWTHVVRFESTVDVRISVQASGGSATCSIESNGNELNAATGSEGSAAECAASAGDIRNAAGG